MNRFYNIILNLSYFTFPLIVILVAYWNEFSLIYRICAIIVVILLYTISYIAIVYARKEGEHFELKYETFELVNANILAVFGTTLIPLACKQFNMSFITLIVICILGALIFIIIKPFIYNPTFAFFDIKIYKITTNEGGVYMLLSKNKIINNMNKIKVIKINEFVLIQE